MQSSEMKDGTQTRIEALRKRIQGLKDDDLYFYNIPITELDSSVEVMVDDRRMLMFASYGYLGLLGHPSINAAARAARCSD